MLEMKAIQDKESQKKMCQLCEIEYIDDALAYSAQNGDTFIGITQFAIHEQTGYIYHISQFPGITDTDALLLLGLTALNFIGRCKIKTVYYENKDIELGDMLGFEKNNNGKYCMNISDLFDKTCCSRN